MITASCFVGPDVRTEPRYRAWIVFITVTITIVFGQASLHAGGNREQPQFNDEVRGEVVSVDRLTNGDLQLGVVTPDGMRTLVIVPSPLAERLRVQTGDQIRSREFRVSNDGERVFVQKLNIERGG